SLLLFLVLLLGVSAEDPPPAASAQYLWGEFWMVRFFLNIAGYGTILIPGYILIQYFKRKNYLETGRGICFPLVKSCVFGHESKSLTPDEPSSAVRLEGDPSTTQQALKLLFCAAGLQVRSGDTRNKSRREKPGITVESRNLGRK
ncbi:hypothetical protein AB205_0100920, partial [Aquarana catesbeiana]